MLLQATEVVKHYGGFRVLNGVSVSVPESGLVGIVGTNGSGKTTLFAVISGLLRAEAGHVRFADLDITQLPARRRAVLGLGRTFQVPREFAHLTVRDNLLVAAPRQVGETLGSICFGWHRVRQEEARLAEQADHWLHFLNLGRVADTLAGNLSGGQKKLLELGRAMMLAPRCLLLDEPFAGVNPVLIEEILHKICELNTLHHIAFLIIEHHLSVLSDLVNDMYVMDRGAVIAQGSPADVLNLPEVQAAYMGGVI